MDNDQRTQGTCIVVLGDGGHARVIRDALLPVESVLVHGEVMPDDGAVVAIGVGDIGLRRKIFERHGGITVVHRSAVLSPTAEIRAGAQIMAGAVIQANARIGRNALVNTSVSVDHDCVVGDHCHIAPGAVLCGMVTLGEGCFIGAGSVIVQGVKLDAGTFIPAGSLVVKQGDIRRPLAVVLADGEAEARISPARARMEV